MARKKDEVDATIVSHIERDGVQYPALLINGDAPRKGSTLRVRLANSIVYSARVYDTTEADGETLVETEGLTPETE